MQRISHLKVAQLGYLFFAVFLLLLVASSPVAAYTDTLPASIDSFAATGSPSVSDFHSFNTNSLSESNIPQGNTIVDSMLSETDPLNPEPQVETNLGIKETQIAPGDSINITATITNTGDVILPSYTLQISLTDGMTFKH